MDGRDLELLLVGQIRQDADEAMREHRLAAAGWTDEQQVVTAGRSDLDGPPADRLTADVGEVVTSFHLRCCVLHLSAGSRSLDASRDGGTTHQRDRLCEIARRPDLESGDERSDTGALLGDEQSARAEPLGTDGDGEDAGHSAQRTVEPDLAVDMDTVESSRVDLTARREDGEREREVEAAPDLREIGRREVHHDAQGRPSEP